MADIVVVDVQVGTASAPPTLTGVTPDCVLIYIYMRKESPGYEEISAVAGLGATWTNRGQYTSTAFQVGVTPSASSGGVTHITTPAAPFPAEATVVLAAVRGIDPTWVSTDLDSYYANDAQENGDYTQKAVAPGQFVLAVIKRQVWSGAHALSFPAAPNSTAGLPWQVRPDAPGVIWLDDTSLLDPRGEEISLDASWTPQPGDDSFELSGQTYHTILGFLVSFGPPTPAPVGELQWGSPVWLDDYEPNEAREARDGRMVWTDETQTKAVVVWTYQTYDANYDPLGDGLRARVVSLTGAVLSAGPLLDMPLPAGWELRNTATDIASIGDGYFVAGVGETFDYEFPDPTVSLERHRVNLFKIGPDGMTLEFVSGTLLPTSDLGITYQPFFAQTLNPNRVLVAAYTKSTVTSSGSIHSIRMWTLTRSGDSLVFVGGDKVGDSGDPILWTDKSRTIGYVGPMEAPSNSTATGSIFTLDPDGNFTITETSTHDHIPHNMTQGRWPSGPGDGQFVSANNESSTIYLAFPLDVVQVTPTGMTVVQSFGQGDSGHFFGDAGWNGGFDRWVPRTVTPDGKIVAFPSVPYAAFQSTRPFMVVIDPVTDERTHSNVLPKNNGWERYADVEDTWGMNAIANATGALVTVSSQQYYNNVETGAGSSGMALVFVPFGDPIWPPTSAIVPGPEGTEPWAALHHGRFRIADFGERRGNVSFGAKMSASGPYFVKIYARFSYWNETNQTFGAVGADVLAYGPSTIGDEGGEFGYESSIFFDIPAHPDATHWQPVIHWFSKPPKAEGAVGEDSGVPPGGKVRMDDFFVPDNGYPINDRPYLDGDVLGGVWEGPRAASTSVYGDRNAAILARMVTLEPELLIPDGDDLDLASLTYLDDDLKI